MGQELSPERERQVIGGANMECGILYVPPPHKVLGVLRPHEKTTWFHCLLLHRDPVPRQDSVCPLRLSLLESWPHARPMGGLNESVKEPHLTNG